MSLPVMASRETLELNSSVLPPQFGFSSLTNTSNLFLQAQGNICTHKTDLQVTVASAFKGWLNIKVVI
jgi:hypothetical protein